MAATEQTTPENVRDLVTRRVAQAYSAGFITDIESETVPPGHSEDVVRLISARKQEPEWMLEWRLEAFRRWQTMAEPTWARVHYPKIDFQDLHYYSAPKSTAGPKSLDEVDPELLAMYEKLGIPLARARDPRRRRGGGHVVRLARRRRRGVRFGVRGHHLQG
jgi:Fe-S cluster assembly protein SufB